LWTHLHQPVLMTIISDLVFLRGGASRTELKGACLCTKIRNYTHRVLRVARYFSSFYTWFSGDLRKNQCLYCFVRLAFSMPYKRRKPHGLRNAVVALVIVLVAVISLIEVANLINQGKPAASANNGSTAPDGAKILLMTSMGNITIQLYTDMPITSGNFKNLTEHGIYDGTLFNRVAEGFVIQGGDATPNGITVPTIQDEQPNKHSNVQGSVAMAKTSQADSATSQFFINLVDNSAALDSNYSVFGQVTAGWDTVVKISQVAITPGLSQTDGTPIQDIIIYQALVVG
jgi:peptidylprolyl isomerase